MNIDDKIQKLFSLEETSLNTEKFIENLHSTQKRRVRRTQNITYGLSSLVVLLLVGIMSISQLTTNGNEYTKYNSIEITDDELEEYFDDLIVYLVKESDDVWSVMEFFYENEVETDI
jgi:hypothetical protein